MTWKLTSNKEKAADNTEQKSKVAPKPEVTPKSDVTIKKYINELWYYSYNYPSVFTLKQESGNQQTFYNNTNDAKLTTSFLSLEGLQGTVESKTKDEQQKHETATGFTCIK